MSWQVTFNKVLFYSDSLSLVLTGLRDLSRPLRDPFDTGPYWGIPACGRTVSLKLNLSPEGPFQLFTLDSDSFMFSPWRIPAKHAETEPNQVSKDNFPLRENIERETSELTFQRNRWINLECECECNSGPRIRAPHFTNREKIVCQIDQANT